MTTTPVLVERSRPTPLLLVPPGPDRAASARVGTSLLGLAVLVDVLRPGPATVAVGLVAMAIVTVFAGLGLVRGGHAMLSAGLAVTFAWAVGLRASPWLVRLDLLAASGLMVLAVSLARGGSLLDLGPDQVARRVLRLMRNALCGPLWAASPRPAHASRAPRAARSGAGGADRGRARRAAGIRGRGVRTPVPARPRPA